VMPPRKVVPDYPLELEQVVIKSLAKDPDNRYQTANELLKALDQLPQSQRASTDEDVGKFVMNLFGDKRAERHAAMSEALARAEEIARTRDAQQVMEAPSPMRQSVHSQVSYVTRTGVSTNDVSGVPTVTNGTGAMTIAGAPSPRRKLVMGAAIAALVLLAGGLFAALKSRPTATSVLPQAASGPVQVASSAPVVASPPVVESATAPQASAVASAVPATDLPDTLKKGVTTAATTNTGKARSGTPNAASNTATATATATKTATKAWKQDPGF